MMIISLCNLLIHTQSGYANPVAEFHIYTLSTGTTAQVSFAGLEADAIIMDVCWVSPKYIATRWTNRVQNQASLFLVDSAAATSELVGYRERAHGWVDYVRHF